MERKEDRLYSILLKNENKLLNPNNSIIVVTITIKVKIK